VIEDHVGHLQVRVRTDIPQPDELRPAAELLVRSALERCAAILEARAPGRIIMVRRLPLQFRCDESVLDDPEQVEELARAAADAIEGLATPVPIDAPFDVDGVVVFADESQLRASQLVALARGRPAWFHSTLDAGDLGGALAALAQPSRRTTAYAALVHLARADLLAEVLAGQPASAIAVLAAALGLDAMPASAIRVAPLRTDEALVQEMVSVVSRWPKLAAPARVLALRAHAAAFLDMDVHRPEPLALAVAVAQTLEAEAAPTPPRMEQAQSDAPSSEQARADEIEPGSVLATRCAGLFYLLDRIQELDLAEALWKACLPEGAVLAAAAAALLGPDFADDPAPGLFGGVDASGGCPEVAAEQHAEVAIETCAALGAALPRRGLAELPPVFIGMVERPEGRMLVASAEGYPFASFAWPAQTPEAVRAGMQAFLEAWPTRGLVAAPPALCTLDITGRLRPRRATPVTPVLVPRAASAAAAALLAIVVGAPCQLFASRIGSPPLDAIAGFVARYLVRTGRVRLGVDEMRVALDAQDVDFDVRRAGLDRDPGWLPWLRRSVRFLFEDRHEA
jgi:hypothetical protein